MPNKYLGATNGNGKFLQGREVKQESLTVVPPDSDGYELKTIG